MRKIVSIAFVLATIISVNGQNENFSFGGGVAFPIESNGDSNVVYVIEANYLFDISDSFQIGPSVSYVNYYGVKYEYYNGEKLVKTRKPDVIFYPIALATHYNISDRFVLGVDLGYAVGVNPFGHVGDEHDGENGFYYRPLVGFNLVEKLMIQVSYSSVSQNNGMFTNLGLGVIFTI